jgi:hypothetical protein
MKANHRETIEAQLTSAKAELEARKKHLASTKKLDDKAVKRDPRYRQIEGVVRQYARRLKAHDQFLAVEQDLVTRRAERAAAPKVKEKKKKVAPEPKAKAKKEGGKSKGAPPA